MSWSFSARGKPAEILEQIDRYGGSLTGQSAVEFRDAAPSISALVNQNFERRDGRDQPTLSLSAYGSGSAQGDEQLERSCTVKLERG